MEKILIGIDEVGRGPIAGPVAVCAVAVTPDELLRFSGVRDSKKISEKKREEWYEMAITHKVRFSVSFASNEVIDKYGIVPAIQGALEASLAKLKIPPNECRVFLDGGLHAPDIYVYQETIIRGDDTEPVISLASILAKVSRDRKMVLYARDFPQYGFERHKGYGTRRHYEAIREHGLCTLHRRSFIV